MYGETAVPIMLLQRAIFYGLFNAQYTVDTAQDISTRTHMKLTETSQIAVA